MSTEEVKVVSCTLLELLLSNRQPIAHTDIQGQLCIPEYQRPYVWTQKQVNRLLNDFDEYERNKDPLKPLYYLGSIILHQTGNNLNIIDGQQRITTLLLLAKLNGMDLTSYIQYAASLSIENIKKNLSYLKAVKSREIYAYQNSTAIENLDLSQINVTLVITTKEDLAYTFFETQNTGGIRLSGSDVIKAHHLRAVPSKKLINYQAKRWESIDSQKVEHIMQYLAKVRYWDNRHWRRFPFYRDERGIKADLIEEFTENTLKDAEDISFHYSAVKKVDGRQLLMHESQYKQLKQPLSDGNNSLDYMNEYIDLHDILFSRNKKDHRVSDAFYDMVAHLMHGHSGTLFLKELLEVAIMAYVSRFGFHRLHESSLWLYRFVYSLRVSTGRNVREDSVFKSVFDNQFIDNILEVYTVNQLLHYLKRYRYSFDTNNGEESQSKGKHINTLRSYFGKDTIKPISEYVQSPKRYDLDFMAAIAKKLDQIE